MYEEDSDEDKVTYADHGQTVAESRGGASNRGVHEKPINALQYKLPGTERRLFQYRSRRIEREVPVSSSFTLCIL